MSGQFGLKRSGHLRRSRECGWRSLNRLGHARFKHSIQHSSPNGPRWAQLDTTRSRVPCANFRRTIKYVEADRRKPRSETEQKSVTPWRMLAPISKGIARFGFGATRGQLRRRPSKPRRSVADDLRVALRRRPRAGTAYPAPSSPPDFLSQLTAVNRLMPVSTRGARTHGSGIQQYVTQTSGATQTI